MTRLTSALRQEGHVTASSSERRITSASKTLPQREQEYS
jgi:hypothetical protein